MVLNICIAIIFCVYGKYSIFDFVSIVIFSHRAASFNNKSTISMPSSFPVFPQKPTKDWRPTIKTATPKLRNTIDLQRKADDHEMNDVRLVIGPTSTRCGALKRLKMIPIGLEATVFKLSQAIE